MRRRSSQGIARDGGDVRFDGVKIFTATLVNDREVLGDKVTAWLQEHKVELADIVVVQSSDAAFHCLSICVFYREPRRTP